MGGGSNEQFRFFYVIRWSYCFMGVQVKSIWISIPYGNLFQGVGVCVCVCGGGGGGGGCLINLFYKRGSSNYLLSGSANNIPMETGTMYF